MIHRYSKLRIIIGLKSIGKWTVVKDWIKAHDLEDEWNAAQWLSSDYEGFDEMVDSICEDCNIVRSNINLILEDAERGWMEA